MQSFKELYWRYSLFVLILGLGVTIFIELTPFLGGVLGAMTIYVLLRRQMHYLTACRKWRRSWRVAAAGRGGALFPGADQSDRLDGRQPGAGHRPQARVDRRAAQTHRSADPRKDGIQPLAGEEYRVARGVIPHLGQWVLGSIMDFGINIVVLLFVLYFMLIGGLRMEEYCREIPPSTATWAAASCARCT